MKLAIIYFLSTYISFQVYNKHYQNPEKDYSIDVPKTTRIERLNLNKPGIYADKFSVFNNKGVNASYAFIIARMAGV